MSEEKKVKIGNKMLHKMKPYTRAWERMANALAREVTPIKPCRDCGRPVITVYCCTWCGSTNP